MDKNFKKIAKKTLEEIFSYVEEKHSNYDVDFEDENLLIEIDENKFILSLHSPTSQIWLSSPISGAHHFFFEVKLQKWINTRDNTINLHDKLFNELQSF